MCPVDFSTGEFLPVLRGRNFGLKLFSTHVKSFETDWNLCPRAEPHPFLSVIAEINGSKSLHVNSGP